MTMPVPPGFPVPRTDQEKREDLLESNGALTEFEGSFILDSTLRKKHRNDATILAFIDEFIRTKSIADAADAVGIKKSEGYRIRHLSDVSNAITKLIDKSAIKHGFDASEMMERAKEIAEFDPIALQNPDGTWKNNLYDIEPSARRNLKKLKVKNIWSESTDMNGIKKPIIIGEVIEYEFYDKTKMIDLAGKEKGLFKTTVKHEHDVTDNMAEVLLASAKRGEDKALAYKTVETQSRNIPDAEVVKGNK